MLKRILQVVMVSFVVFSSAFVFASEVKELSSQERGPGRKRPSASDRLLCVDGLKVFQTIAFGYGDGTGAAVSNIQLFEEENGKVVPVRCE
jgi:hypothetical protein